MQMNQRPKSARKHVEMQMIKTLAVMLKFRAVLLLSLLSSTALPSFNQATAAALCASPSQTKKTPKKKQENKNRTVPLKSRQ